MVGAKLVTYGVVGDGYGLAGSVVTAAIAMPWLAAKDIHVVLGAGDVAAYGFALALAGTRLAMRRDAT